MTETEKTFQSSSSDSSSAKANEVPRHQNHHLQSRSKRERYKASGDLLALKQQLEGKFVMSEESYAPHTLCVKRWKKGEFNEPDFGSGDLISFCEQPMVEVSYLIIDN
jgi:hypothetical protein